jgi:hypothetical protein
MLRGHHLQKIHFTNFSMQTGKHPFILSCRASSHNENESYSRSGGIKFESCTKSVTLAVILKNFSSVSADKRGDDTLNYPHSTIPPIHNSQ